MGNVALDEVPEFDIENDDRRGLSDIVATVLGLQRSEQGDQMRGHVDSDIRLHGMYVNSTALSRQGAVKSAIDARTSRHPGYVAS